VYHAHINESKNKISASASREAHINAKHTTQRKNCAMSIVEWWNVGGRQPKRAPLAQLNQNAFSRLQIDSDDDATESLVEDTPAHIDIEPTFQELHADYRHQCVDSCFMELKDRYPLLEYERTLSKFGEPELYFKWNKKTVTENMYGFIKNRSRFAATVANNYSNATSYTTDDIQTWRRFLRQVLLCIYKRLNYIHSVRNQKVGDFKNIKNLHAALINAFTGLMTYIGIFQDCSRARHIWEAAEYYQHDVVTANPDYNDLYNSIRSFADESAKRVSQTKDTMINRSELCSYFIHKLERDPRVIYIVNIIECAQSWSADHDVHF
jgi:hypothetical protein